MGEISSKISVRPLRSVTTVSPAAFVALTLAFHAGAPTSHSKLSVCKASRSGTSTVSEILANVSRWATRPFVGVVDAGRAAAKSNYLQGSQKSLIVGDQTGQKQRLELSTMSSPRRYTRGSLIDRNMKIREVREAISNDIPCEGYLSTQLFVFPGVGITSSLEVRP